MVENFVAAHILNLKIWLELGSWAVDLLVAIIAFFGTTTGLSILKRWKKRRDEKKAQQSIHKEHINNMEVYRLVTNLRLNTNFDRILIFEGKNTGTPGKPLTPYTIKCVQASCNDYHDEIKALYDFKEFIPDADYREMLANITNPLGEGIIETVTEDLNISRLKEIYQAENIKRSYIFLVGVSPNNHRLVYGSAAQLEGNDNEIDVKDINELKISIDHLRKYL